MWRHLVSRSAGARKAITAGRRSPLLVSTRALPTIDLDTYVTPLKQSQPNKSFTSSHGSASPVPHAPKETTEYEVDHLVIGAGVVGLAVAERLSARGAGSTLLVDKNPGAGQETRYKRRVFCRAAWLFRILFYESNSVD